MAARNQLLGTVLIKISIAVLVLLVGSYLFLRFDLSRNRSFSLSRQSRETVRNLKDDVLVKVFASKELPPQFSGISRSLRDILVEFQRESRGKFRFEYVKAASNDELISQAQDYQLRSYTVHISEKEQLVSKQVVLGIAFEGGGKATGLELMPGMEPKLEYQIMKKIGRIDGALLPELTVFADSLSLMYHFGANQNELYSFFFELQENFTVLYTDLKTQPRFTPVMLSLGVVGNLEEIQLYHFDQYLMRGGKVVMVQDRVQMAPGPYGTAVFENESNLFNLLQHYGVMIRPNIVLDRECEIRQGLGAQIPYPFSPLVRANQEHPVTKGFDTVFLYMASELVLLPESTLQMEPILKTSNRSNRMSGPVFDLESSIRQGLDPGYLNLPPLTVAAHIRGKFKSFFTEAKTDSTFFPSSDTAEILLFGDSELPMDFGAGAFIVLNAVDYLLGRYQMITLRSRNPQPSLLSLENYLQKNEIQSADPQAELNRLNLLFRLTSILAPALLMILLGTVVEITRYRTKK